VRKAGGVIDAEFDWLYDLVTQNLGLYSAIEKVEPEALQGRQPSGRKLRGVQDAVEEAAGGSCLGLSPKLCSHRLEGAGVAPHQ